MCLWLALNSGFGRVFVATYQGVKVAVKEPIDVSALTPSAINEFRDELNLAYSMRHKNIVRRTPVVVLSRTLLCLTF